MSLARLLYKTHTHTYTERNIHTYIESDFDFDFHSDGVFQDLVTHTQTELETQKHDRATATGCSAVIYTIYT